jgi:hypothetical protein
MRQRIYDPFLGAGTRFWLLVFPMIATPRSGLLALPFMRMAASLLSFCTRLSLAVQILMHAWDVIVSRSRVSLRPANRSQPFVLCQSHQKAAVRRFARSIKPGFNASARSCPCLRMRCVSCGYHVLSLALALRLRLPKGSALSKQVACISLGLTIHVAYPKHGT